MVTIIIEDKKDGKDSKFIHALINKIFEIKPDYEIISGGGYTNLSNISPSLEQNQDLGIKNLFIYDTDSDNNNGGFDDRKKYLEDKLKELNIQFELFLLPNNIDDGNFETLYEKIINQGHKGIIDCFNKYENCLKQYKDNEIEKYKSPNQKAKMYAYIEAFKNSRFKSNDYKFDNPEYWDLDNEYLEPLKQFLKTNMGNDNGNN